MKKITKDELDVFLRKHKLWLVDDPAGERADLRGADLTRADLRRANLWSADLRGADLTGANLWSADLRGADLRRANLWSADLRGADLRRANLWSADLRGADLTGANLWSADLTRADLTRADLTGADLTGADLRGADLTGADLTGADLTGADLTDIKNLNYPIACPEKGSFIGFKKCQNNLIVELEIPADALRCSATSRKCRCSKATVLSITDLEGADAGVVTVSSNYDSTFTYTVGETVEVKDFDENRWNECAPGIHFFITRQEAVNY